MIKYEQKSKPAYTIEVFEKSPDGSYKQRIVEAGYKGTPAVKVSSDKGAFDPDKRLKELIAQAESVGYYNNKRV